MGVVDHSSKCVDFLEDRSYYSTPVLLLRPTAYVLVRLPLLLLPTCGTSSGSSSSSGSHCAGSGSRSSSSSGSGSSQWQQRHWQQQLRRQRQRSVAASAALSSNINSIISAQCSAFSPPPNSFPGPFLAATVRCPWRPRRARLLCRCCGFSLPLSRPPWRRHRTQLFCRWRSFPASVAAPGRRAQAGVT